MAGFHLDNFPRDPGHESDWERLNIALKQARYHSLNEVVFSEKLVVHKPVVFYDTITLRGDSYRSEIQATNAPDSNWQANDAVVTLIPRCSLENVKINAEFAANEADTGVDRVDVGLRAIKARSLQKTHVTGAAKIGYHIEQCEVRHFYDLEAASNKGVGFFIERSNALVIYGLNASNNRGTGVYITGRPASQYSRQKEFTTEGDPDVGAGGMTIFGGTVQYNGDRNNLVPENRGHGIHVENLRLGLTRIESVYMEGNTGDCLRIEAASYVHATDLQVAVSGYTFEDGWMPRFARLLGDVSLGEHGNTIAYGCHRNIINRCAVANGSGAILRTSEMISMADNVEHDSKHPLQKGGYNKANNNFYLSGPVTQYGHKISFLVEKADNILQ